MFVTCFDTVEPSPWGVIQVSDRFLCLFLPSLYVSIRGLNLDSPVSSYITQIPVAMADTRSTDRIGNYTKFWDKDREHEKSEVQGARVDNYTEVVNG